MTKTKKSTEVAKVKSAPPATVVPEGSWGSEGIDTADVLIPKLLLMQGLSDFVGEGKATIGDIVKSTSCELVAAKNDKATFIPLTSSKSWRIMEKEGARFEWRRNEVWTPENSNRELQWEENGTEWRADRAINFFVLLVKDIEREAEMMAHLQQTGDLIEGGDVLLPCQLQFLRTSYSTGKQLVTEFAKARKFKKPPAAWMFNIFSAGQKNDQGNYQIFQVEPAGVTAPAHLAVAYEWYKTITSQDVKVHETGTDEPAKPSAEDTAEDRY